MYFAVTRERGPAWNGSRSLPEQEQWAAHAAFMNALVDDGFVVLGGPLGDGSKTLLILNATSEQAIHAQLAADPWTRMGLLAITTIEPWRLLLGEVPGLRDAPGPRRRRAGTATAGTVADNAHPKAREIYAALPAGLVTMDVATGSSRRSAARRRPALGLCTWPMR